MLLIEGSDCLGKTMLAKSIVRKISDMGLPVVYSWMTRPNEEKFGFFNEYRLLINPYAVQDRFHLSGMAYHDNKISKSRLEIINAWIRSIGGLIVILYANDSEWYKSILNKDGRGNLLSNDAMVKANLFFRGYAKNSDCNYAFNIMPCNSMTGPNYVNEANIDEIIEVWLHRRTNLGTGYV